MNEQVKAIRAEIDRRYEENREKARYDDYYRGMNDGLDHLEQFIDSQPDEQPNKDLETEIATWIPAHINGIDGDEWKDRNQTVYITLSAIIGWSGCIARHFAKWGAEHLIDGNKMIEEAAEEYEKNHAYQRYDGGGFTPEYDATLAEAFEAGAKWQAKQMPMSEDTVLFQKGVAEGKRLMMEDAIEGRVIETYNPVTEEGKPYLRGITLIYEDKNKPYLTVGDIFKFIITNED